MAAKNQVVITAAPDGIFVEYDFAEMVDLAHAAVTLVRAVSEALRADPQARRHFAGWVAEAAIEGGAQMRKVDEA